MVSPSTTHQSWRSLGRLIKADAQFPWFASHTGAACAIPGMSDSRGVSFLLTARDSRNRSTIGIITIDPVNVRVLDVSPEPVLSHGALGCFDENGVSYPSLVLYKGEYFLYYTGWMPTVLTPFQNHIGLASGPSLQSLKRVSRAPILCRTDDEPFGHGSCHVLYEDGEWRMWYTTIHNWTSGADGKAGHEYHIRYATGDDPLHWRRDGRVAIASRGAHETSIAKPSVLKRSDGDHMWYCSRGDRYKIGYAHSTDGRSWTRLDSSLAFRLSGEPWDALEQSYPCVFEYHDVLYMLYAGNSYGREGLGLAVLERES